VYLRVRTRQFLIAAHVMGLVEIISDEGRLQDYGEVHGDLFYKYTNENILIKLPDSTKKNCSILCVRINPGYVCAVPAFLCHTCPFCRIDAARAQDAWQSTKILLNLLV